LKRVIKIFNIFSKTLIALVSTSWEPREYALSLSFSLSLYLSIYLSN